MKKLRNWDKIKTNHKSSESSLELSPKGEKGVDKAQNSPFATHKKPKMQTEKWQYSLDFPQNVHISSKHESVEKVQKQLRRQIFSHKDFEPILNTERTKQLL